MARALDLVGERWTLLLVRELMTGPKRFKDLVAGLPGIGTNLLTDRLKELERTGIVSRRVLPPPAGSTVYELTEVGLGLEAVVFALGRWGHQFLYPLKSSDALNAGWFMVALRGTLRPEIAGDRKQTFELQTEGKVFTVTVSGGQVQSRQGPADEPDVILKTGLNALIGLLTQAVKPKAALRDGSVRVEGDPQGLQRFVELFGWS